MLIVDVSEVKLPVEAKQNNIPPECGLSIDGVLKVSTTGQRSIHEGLALSFVTVDTRQNSCVELPRT
jgi:hypothetical protein